MESGGVYVHRSFVNFGSRRASYDQADICLWHSVIGIDDDVDLQAISGPF